MMKVYVCSPYRAKDGAELDRNIEYAQALTRRALKAGLAPITPHLYITQCLDEKKPQERAQGLAAGMELLKGCDFMIVGDKYGISEGMYREIETAKALCYMGAAWLSQHYERTEETAVLGVAYIGNSYLANTF